MGLNSSNVTCRLTDSQAAIVTHIRSIMNIIEMQARRRYSISIHGTRLNGTTGMR